MKSQGSNSGDGGDTRDGGKIVGGAIGARGSEIDDSLLVSSYACMPFIYGSSWTGEMASEAKRYLDKSSEGSGEGPPVKKEPTLSLVVVCLYLILTEPVLFNFFHLHSESASGYDALADSTAEVDPGLSNPNDSIPSQQGTNEESRADEISKKIKLEDLSDLLKDIRSAFFIPDSPQDEPIIVSDESEEEEKVAKDKDTHASSYDVPEDTSTPYPPSLKSAHIQELMAQVQLLQSQKDELEQQKGKS
ncbi:hypothetical protein Tco_1523887 [Tanacetum coccineum]